MPTVDEIRTWSGREVVGPDGGKVGKLDHLYLDRQTGEPTFAAVKTGLFGSNDSLVPVEGASLRGEDVTVAFDKAKIKGAPNVEADGELSEAEEARLYEYYGITGYSSYDGPEHATVTDYETKRQATQDSAITRSEEELRVGKRQKEAGKARLRKYIVTENVTTTVPISHEEVRIAREPITDGRGANVELGEQEIDVTLHAETPVVEKQVVAKERVRLDVDTVTENVEVKETVRKEQIEVDEDTTPSAAASTATRLAVGEGRRPPAAPSSHPVT